MVHRPDHLCCNAKLKKLNQPDENDDDLHTVIRVILEANQNLKKKVRDLEEELRALKLQGNCKSEDGSGNVDSSRNSGSLSVKQMHTSLERGRGDDCKCLHGTKLQCNLKPELTKCNVEKHFASREEKFEDGSDSFTSKDILESLNLQGNCKSEDGSDSFSKDGLEKSGKQTADGDSKDVLESLKLQGNCKSEDGSDSFTSKDILGCLKLQGNLKPDKAELTAGNSKDVLESLNLQGNLKPASREEKFRMTYWRTCKYCSKIHQFGSERCPAFGKVCRNCLSKNHFASVCWNKKKKMRKCNSLANCKSSVEMSSDQEQYKVDFDRISAKSQILKRNPNESSEKYDKDFKEYQGHGSTDGLGRKITEGLIQTLKSSERYDPGSQIKIKNVESSQNLKGKSDETLVERQSGAEDIKSAGGNDQHAVVESKQKMRMSWEEELSIMRAFNELSQEEKMYHDRPCKIEGCVKCRVNLLDIPDCMRL